MSTIYPNPLPSSQTSSPSVCFDLLTTYRRQSCRWDQAGKNNRVCETPCKSPGRDGRRRAGSAGPPGVRWSHLSCPSAAAAPWLEDGSTKAADHRDVPIRCSASLLSPLCSAQWNKPFPPDTERGPIPTPEVQQWPFLILLLLTDQPAAPSHVWSPAAQQAEAFPHHPAAVWE